LKDVDITVISLDLKVSVIRVSETYLFPSILNIKTFLSPTEKCTERSINNIITKIHYYFDNIIDNSIIFNIENDYAKAMFFFEDGKTKTSNMYVFTPGEPDDELLAKLFAAKLNALGEGDVEFNSCEINSNNEGGLKFEHVGLDFENSLPTMKEWMEEDNLLFDQPWWMRDDASCLDTPIYKGSKIPIWAHKIKFNNKKTKVSIDRPDFKPKVITGGKK